MDFGNEQVRQPMRVSKFLLFTSRVLQTILETPVVVEENGVANITIIVDPYSWFTDGANILDPIDPVNENDIDNNIKDSFKKAFKDNDHDGVIDM